ncbi:bicaudal isoform B, putative [Acanthamoeba castellanii str. Neff]|jgi:nascent polypeptide-associated complex subunit beta|uniref:Nascent polypeptide-associated complex subunit beta n=1 Tax=Acanthamoeba castellanii (strain ATCC 30010 / Neff) TaxID=1257118 RepID=L8HE68_ACACF|nr:bicaudal isoform B, putative [Acanthamoeba castellanii str. Neff]ELR23522.1 bicaudal isoform B, putative [Acanthamoeba castellanii str. Neff]
MNAQKLAQLQQGVRIGGKGTPRRKHKAPRKKNATTDDKKLQSQLQKLGCQPMQGIEEVNLYKDDGTVIHFNNPKFHVGSGATMYVVSGRAENKTIQDIIPSLLQNSALGQAAAAAAAAKKGGDDDVPELVESFESS